MKSYSLIGKSSSYVKILLFTTIFFIYSINCDTLFINHNTQCRTVLQMFYRDRFDNIIFNTFVLFQIDFLQLHLQQNRMKVSKAVDRLVKLNL